MLLPFIAVISVTIYCLATFLKVTDPVMNNVSVAGGPRLAALECAGRGSPHAGGKQSGWRSGGKFSPGISASNEVGALAGFC